jgi:twitching motility two-component system response regulator PilH
MLTTQLHIKWKKFDVLHLGEFLKVTSNKLVHFEEIYVTIHSILCVDDSPSDLRMLETTLTAAGYVVATAQNGKQAVEAAARIKPDLVFMDVNMPEMDGFQATRTLSGSAETKMIPVVLVTAKDQKADRVWAQMLGVKGYITKPYPPQSLLDIVKAIG